MNSRESHDVGRPKAARRIAEDMQIVLSLPRDFPAAVRGRIFRITVATGSGITKLKP